MATARIHISGEPSYLGSLAGSAQQVLVHVRVKPSGSLDTLRVIVDDDGKVSVTRGDTSRKKLREDFDELFRETTFRLGQAPADYVAWRIRQVIDAHRARGGYLSPSDLHAVDSIHAPTEAPPHPALQLWPVPDAASLLDTSVGLHTEPEFRPWMPSKAVLSSISEHVLKARAAPPPERRIVIPGEVLPEINPLDAVRDGFNAAIDAWYGTEDRRREVATTLLDAALVFESSRRHDKALGAVATAHAVLHAPDLHQVPFVYGLIYKYVLVQKEQSKLAAEGYDV